MVWKMYRRRSSLIPRPKFKTPFQMKRRFVTKKTYNHKFLDFLDSPASIFIKNCSISISSGEFLIERVK